MGEYNVLGTGRTTAAVTSRRRSALAPEGEAEDTVFALHRTSKMTSNERACALDGSQLPIAPRPTLMCLGLWHGIRMPRARSTCVYETRVRWRAALLSSDSIDRPLGSGSLEGFNRASAHIRLKNFLVSVLAPFRAWMSQAWSGR